ncbi:hypothetical protein ATCC90586_000994 [Pythium insidiosum]|nr:hypothetical protein ATCC90586_000994 [Pythium insidiosum]
METPTLNVEDFAVGPDGLPRIRFSEERRQQYEDICDDLIQRALEEHHAFHSSTHMNARWKLVRQRDALSVYRHRTPVPPLCAVPVAGAHARGPAACSRSSLMMASGFLPGTLNDTMLGVYCDTTETLRIVKSILSDRFLDGAMVHVFEKNSIRAPIIFSGIKWFAMQSPGGHLIHNRDALCFERMGRIVDTDGNYFAYHVLQSIDLVEWPANRSKLLRVSLSMCYLYRQVSDHWVGCFMLGDYDPGGSVPQSISDFAFADMMLSVGNVLECAHAKRFSMLMLHNAETVPSESRYCNICCATPGLFKSADKAMQLCVGCHRRVCRRCRLSCTIFRLSMRSRTPKKEWFCRECVGQVVVGPPRRHNWADSDNYSTPSSAQSVSPATSEAAEPFSVRSDKESKLYEMDVEALAELAHQWSINDNNTRGLVWNAEELARLSDRLNSSRVKRHAEAKSKQKVSLPVPKTKASRLASLFGRKKATAVDDDDNTRDRADTNWVPGNSYSGGACDWRANAVRLNAAVADPFADDEAPPTVDSAYTPSAHTRDLTMAITCGDIPRFICAIILPPLGVFFQVGCTKDLAINILLTILGLAFVVGLLTLLVPFIIIKAKHTYVGGLLWPFVADMSRDMPSSIVFTIGLNALAFLVATTWLVNVERHRRFVRTAALDDDSMRRYSSLARTCTVVGVVGACLLPLYVISRVATRIHRLAGAAFLVLEGIACVINSYLNYKICIAKREELESGVFVTIKYAPRSVAVEKLTSLRRSKRGFLIEMACSALFLMCLFVYLPLFYQVQPAHRLTVQECQDRNLGEHYCKDTVRLNEVQTSLWSYEMDFAGYQVRAFSQLGCLLTLLTYLLSFTVAMGDDEEEHERRDSQYHAAMSKESPITTPESPKVY